MRSNAELADALESLFDGPLEFIDEEVELVRQAAAALRAGLPEDGALLRACQRRIHGFMLDCNAIGLLGAAENLHKGLKQDAAMLAAAPSPEGE